MNVLDTSIQVADDQRRMLRAKIAGTGDERELHGVISVDAGHDKLYLRSARQIAEYDPETGSPTIREESRRHEEERRGRDQF